MSLGAIVAAVVSTYLAGAVLPGPTFLFVTHTAVTSTRRHALCAAAGIAAGTVVLATLGVFGAHAVLGQSTLLDRVLHIGCGMLLIYLGVRIGLGSNAAHSMDAVRASLSAKQTFWRGVLTMASNPKAIMLFGTTLTALLSHPAAPVERLTVVLAVALTSACWNAILALTFSYRPVQRLYGRARPTLDRLAACVLAGIGLTVVFG